jgi:hypothetical protein
MGSRRNANHRLARSAMTLVLSMTGFTHAVDRTRRSGADSSSCHRSDEEDRMHWKKRQKQIQYPQAKRGSDRSLAREFSDLKVGQRTAPCSNGMGGNTARRVSPPGHETIPYRSFSQTRVELIIPGTDLQWMGGKKP